MSLGKSLYKVIIPTTLLAACTSAAQANFSFNELSPFVGVDVGQSNTKLQQKFGGPIFRKNATSYNFFGGLEFNEFFGMEIGCQRDNTRRKNNAKLVTGDNFPGGEQLVPADSPSIFNTNLKSKSKYFGVILKYKTINNISFSGMVGISNVSIRANQEMISSAGHTFTPLENAVLFLTRTYKKSKIVPLLRAGGQYKINNFFTIRANATWIGTSKLKINSKQNGLPRPFDNTPDFSVRLKNTMKYSLGIIFYPF